MSTDELRSAGLTDDEIRIYRQGPVSQSRRGIAYGTSYLFGFGIGHMIAKKWTEFGFVFTAGEAASIGGMIAGAVILVDENSAGETSVSTGGALLIAGSALTFLGLRIWEIFDLAMRANEHKKLYRSASEKLNKQASVRFVPYLSKEFDPGLALQVRF